MPKNTRNTTPVEPSWTYWYLLDQGKLHTMSPLGESDEEGIRTVL